MHFFSYLAVVGLLGMLSQCTFLAHEGREVCLPPQMAPTVLQGKILGTARTRGGTVVVRMQTTHGTIDTYWADEVLIGIDMAPDNITVPLWVRDRREGCQWTQGRAGQQSREGT